MADVRGTTKDSRHRPIKAHRQTDADCSHAEPSGKHLAGKGQSPTADTRETLKTMGLMHITVVLFLCFFTAQMVQYTQENYQIILVCIAHHQTNQTPERRQKHGHKELSSLWRTWVSLPELQSERTIVLCDSEVRCVRSIGQGVYGHRGCIEKGMGNTHMLFRHRCMEHAMPRPTDQGKGNEQ